MANKIKSKLNVGAFDELKEKAKKILQKSKENDETLEENNWPTLNTIADQLQQESTELQTKDIQNVKENNPIDVNTPTQWIFQPAYLNTNNLLNKNGILTPTNSEYQAPIPYSPKEADINDNIFNPDLSTTPQNTLVQRVSDLLDANTTQIAQDTEKTPNFLVDPDLTLRYMENNWYWYDTTPFAPEQYNKETEGMTLEEKAQYLEQKEREYKEVQEKKNREIQTNIQNLSMEDLSKFDKEVYEIAQKLNMLEGDSLSNWGFWNGLYAWMIDINNSLGNTLDLYFAKESAKQNADKIENKIFNEMLKQNKIKYTTSWWAGIFSDPYERIRQIKNEEGDWTTVPKSEYQEALYNYWKQLEAYQNGETTEKPTMEFWLWYAYGREVEDEKTGEERREFSELKTMDDKDIMDIYEVMKEHRAGYEQMKEGIETSIAIYRESLWLQEWEKLQINKWVVKIYKSQEQELETEKSDAVDNAIDTGIEEIWLFKDQVFLWKNTTQKTLLLQQVTNNVTSKADDWYNYRRNTDNAIAKINAWYWTFSDEASKQKALLQLQELKDKQTRIINQYLVNAAEAELLYAYYGWDEDAIRKAMRERLGYSDSNVEHMGFTILSDFYMRGIEENNRGFAWYDVTNRLHNTLASYSQELDDILDEAWLIWTGTKVRHNVEDYLLSPIWQVLEAWVSIVPTLLDLTPIDGWKYVAWETQLGVYKKWYWLQWDLWRFWNSITWIAPEVFAFFIWWTWSGLSQLWRGISWISRFQKAVKSWVEVAEASKKINFLWRWFQKLQKAFDNFWMERTLSKIRKLWESSEDVAKTEQLLSKAVLRNQTLKTFGNVAKDIIESVYQDWAFFNRWDTEYMTGDQDKWTVYWALFCLADLPLLSATRWWLKKFANATIDQTSRWLGRIWLWLTWTAFDTWWWSKVIDTLQNVASKWIWRWWIVSWTLVDMVWYFSKHTDELAWTMLKSLWLDTPSFMRQLKELDKSQVSNIAPLLQSAWDSIFAQSQEAARLLNLIKERDTTWLVALWEKQYVWAMLSSFLSWKTNVNNQELARMINDTWYTVPDMIKRYFNLPWIVADNSWTSNLFLQIDAQKMHQVTYPRELDFITPEKQFVPTKQWTESEILHAHSELDRQGSWLKDVFDINNSDEYFTKMKDWTYLLNKEWLNALWYSNTKLIPEVLAQTSDNTADFVWRLREINQANGVEVVSEKLISDIEKTDAYEKLSSHLWGIVC